MRVLVTGIAGFVGFHVGRRLLQDGHDVVGVDNVNPYYDPALKRSRLNELKGGVADTPARYAFHEIDICRTADLTQALKLDTFDTVIHLAAQPGIRYSLEAPQSYIQSNVVGFGNILELCRNMGKPHLVFASSSSVYGANEKLPHSEHDIADHPLQLYAATKRAGELIAHSYAHIYGLPTTGLRLFTVYGPWGRPDMSLFTFVKRILADQPIQLANYGNHSRDFTYIDDVVQSILRAVERPPTRSEAWSPMIPDPAIGDGPFRLLNIGGGRPVTLNEYVDAIEGALGKKAVRELVPGSAAEMRDTRAATEDQTLLLGIKPQTDIRLGVRRFVDWYLAYFAE